MWRVQRLADPPLLPMSWGERKESVNTASQLPDPDVLLLPRPPLFSSLMGRGS